MHVRMVIKFIRRPALGALLFVVSWLIGFVIQEFSGLMGLRGLLTDAGFLFNHFTILFAVFMLALLFLLIMNLFRWVQRMSTAFYLAFWGVLAFLFFAGPDVMDKIYRQPLVTHITVGSPLYSYRYTEERSVLDRPPLLLVRGSDPSRDFVQRDFTESLWKSIRPKPENTYESSSVSRDGFYLPLPSGNTPEQISRKLDDLIRTFKQGWWCKSSTGYIVSFNLGWNCDQLNKRLKDYFPPSSLFSDNFQKSIQFLHGVTGLTLTLAAKHPLWVPMKVNPFWSSPSEEPEYVVFQSEGVQASSDYLRRWAAFHNCDLNLRNNKAFLIDLSPRQIKNLASATLTHMEVERRCFSVGNFYLLPPGAAGELLSLIRGKDDDSVRALLERLLISDVSVDPGLLEEILSQPLHYTMETHARAALQLLKQGDPAAIPQITHLYWQGFDWEELFRALTHVPTKQSADLQRWLLSVDNHSLTVFKIGLLEIESVPKGVTEKEAQQVLLMAVALANRLFSGKRGWHSHTFLDFKPDGETALCEFFLRRSRHHSETCLIRLRKTSGIWFPYDFPGAGNIGLMTID